MLILNYFKQSPKELSGNLSEVNLQLPDPRDPLCTISNQGS